MNDEQRAALLRFAGSNGRTWKQNLRNAWSTGAYATYGAEDDSHLLQQLRNSQDFGPRGLVAFHLIRVEKNPPPDVHLICLDCRNLDIVTPGDGNGPHRSCSDCGSGNLDVAVYGYSDAYGRDCWHAESEERAAHKAEDRARIAAISACYDALRLLRLAGMTELHQAMQSTIERHLVGGKA